MLVYSAAKYQFHDDVVNHNIAQVIKSSLFHHGIFDENDREFVSWENSLVKMDEVLEDDRFSDDVQVAVEYQVPQTAKRVDFIVSGADEKGKENVVIVELKQWERAQRTMRDGLVSAYTGGMTRVVAHPSYQAYSYAKTIENFCSTVQDKPISLYPCAYLHNYSRSYIDELVNDSYQEVLDEAPLFIRNDLKKLRDFIGRYVRSAAKSNLMVEIDNGKIRPSKALQDTLASMMHGNPEFILIDEQKVAYETVRRLVELALLNNKKYTIIVEGGPGTGKSVVAVSLLADLITKGRTACYVTKNAAPRNVYFEELKQGKFRNNYVKFLFKGSGSFVESRKNDFDCLIVDEAHRLNEKSGMYKNKGVNQIKEIIDASKVSVFFIDEDQVVTSSDIGSVCEIEKWAKLCGSEICYSDDIKLTSQFRCNGSSGYVAFLDDLLGIRKTANADGFDLDFDFRIFDNPLEMREELRKKNEINNKARMIAGYCYEWITKNSNDLNVYDIELPGGFKARWNFNSTSTWAIDPDSFEQVGCIHTSQGLEFDYIGIIIGKDLRYENGRVITDPSRRAKSDASLRGIKNRPEYAEKVDRIIRNTYKVLMTRGQKGCYIYCEDSNLQQYIKSRLVAGEEDRPGLVAEENAVYEVKKKGKPETGMD